MKQKTALPFELNDHGLVIDGDLALFLTPNRNDLSYNERRTLIFDKLKPFVESRGVTPRFILDFTGTAKPVDFPYRVPRKKTRTFDHDWLIYVPTIDKPGLLTPAYKHPDGPVNELMSYLDNAKMELPSCVNIRDYICDIRGTVNDGWTGGKT